MKSLWQGFAELVSGRAFNNIEWRDYKPVIGKLLLECGAGFNVWKSRNKMAAKNRR